MSCRPPSRLLLLLAASLIGCGPASSTGSTVVPGESDPGQGPRPVGPHEGDTASELAERLDRLRVRQTALVPTASQDAGVCEDVCSLATSICGVKEKLCLIADDHPQDNEYQRLCREAKVECRAAQDNCVACVEGGDDGS